MNGITSTSHRLLLWSIFVILLFYIQACTDWLRLWKIHIKKEIILIFLWWHVPMHFYGKTHLIANINSIIVRILCHWLPQLQLYTCSAYKSNTFSRSLLHYRLTENLEYCLPCIVFHFQYLSLICIVKMFLSLVQNSTSWSTSR